MPLMTVFHTRGRLGQNRDVNTAKVEETGYGELAVR